MLGSSEVVILLLDRNNRTKLFLSFANMEKFCALKSCKKIRIFPQNFVSRVTSLDLCLLRTGVRSAVPSFEDIKRKNLFLYRRRLRHRFCAKISLVKNQSILF